MKTTLDSPQLYDKNIVEWRVKHKSLTHSLTLILSLTSVHHSMSSLSFDSLISLHSFCFFCLFSFHSLSSLTDFSHLSSSLSYSFFYNFSHLLLSITQCLFLLLSCSSHIVFSYLFSLFLFFYSLL